LSGGDAKSAFFMIFGRFSPTLLSVLLINII
jgi:hypothetical protein